MIDKVKHVLKNISYSIFSNGINLLISMILILIIPRLIGVTSYSYWQLYVFYTSYSGLVNIGWVEGIYLRIGGIGKEEVDKKYLSSQGFYFILFSIVTCSALYLSTSFLFDDGNEIFIFQMFAISTFFTVVRGFIQFVFQSIDLIKEYAKTIIIDRALYAVIVILLLMLGYRDYKILIILDIFSKIIGLIFTIYLSRDLITFKIYSFKNSFFDALSNIKIGINLLLSNVASQLIIGVVRLGIKSNWPIDIFGKVSLSLSLINFFMIFINAIGIVMFPFLKKEDEKKYSHFYPIVRSVTVFFLFLVLCLYFPASLILNLWLPAYSDSIKFMSVLLPICLFEGKNIILVNTYFKALRREKNMLLANSISLLFACGTTFFSIYIFNSLMGAVLCLFLNIAFKCMLSELLLSKIIKIKINASQIIELSLCLLYIGSAYYLTLGVGLSIYFLLLGTYLLLNRSNLRLFISVIKKRR